MHVLSSRHLVVIVLDGVVKRGVAAFLKSHDHSFSSMVLIMVSKYQIVRYIEIFK